MIAYDFEYYKPSSVQEAIDIFEELSSKNMQPLYYSGGTEIITMARRNDIFTKAVIDIKAIPECNIFGEQGNEFAIGAAVPLTQVADYKSFPMLNENAKFPADHSARNKITLCGNICGKIIYREAVLGLLITESKVIIAGKSGLRVVPINEAFKKTMQLAKGEFVVQIRTEKDYASLPYIAIKRTKQGKTGYPLISMVALKKDNKIRIAFSGVCNFPFRSLEVEEYLNNRNVPVEGRLKEAVNHLPAPILDNIQGSAEYRKFVLENKLLEVLIKLEGED